MQESANALLQIKQVTKTFPSVVALDRVDLTIGRDSILGLVGENGAGKSTLMKILGGIYPHGTYEGALYMDGRECRFQSAQDSIKAGLAFIHQELSLFPELSIAENIALPVMGTFTSRAQINAFAKKYMDMVKLNERPEMPVKNLGVGKQQMVEIAKALTLNARILILDEPTSALSGTDIKVLLDLLRTLRGNGISCIYISHKLDEVLDISDTISVLRDGKLIKTLSRREVQDEEQIVEWMVGRAMTGRFPEKIPVTSKEHVLEVKNFTAVCFNNPERKVFEDISFYVRKGEILGIAGLVGAGRTELVNSLFGDFKGRMISGEIRVAGEKVNFKHPSDAICKGIGLCTEDRKTTGLILDGSVADNILTVNIDSFTKHGFVQKEQAYHSIKTIVEKTTVKTPSLDSKVKTLSGGNQQKVVISKWLLAQPRVLIFDEPTRGIDVGAKYDIYELMNSLKAIGVGIIMVSSELTEILGMSDRIMVMREGRMVCEHDGNSATQVDIMKGLV